MKLAILGCNHRGGPALEIRGGLEAAEARQEFRRMKSALEPLNGRQHVELWDSEKGMVDRYTVHAVAAESIPEANKPQSQTKKIKSKSQ